MTRAGRSCCTTSPSTAPWSTDRHVQGAVEVGGAGLRADHRATRVARDLDALAVIGLSRIALVKQLDVDADELVVVTLDLRQLVGDMLPVMIGHLDVAALDDDVHS